MTYSPQLNRRSCATLRRIAWALDVPMTRAIDRVIEDAVQNLENGSVCLACKDSSVCDSCAFWDVKNLAPVRRLKDMVKKPDFQKIYKGSQVHVCLVRENNEPLPAIKISSPRDVFELVGKHMRSCDREVILSILLASDSSLIGVEKVSVGTLDQCMVSQRELFKSAILANASSIIICHCHPSGSAVMSSHDKRLSEAMYKAGKLLGIRVVDHILIAGDGYVSHRETENSVFE
jgi:DNA repair protein RadC